jgi:hypothetical protein
MTDSGSLQDSLAAMGFIELGLALTALSCYALAFSGALRLKIRGSAACAAFVAAGAFAALTNPWVHGVILIAIGVAGMGVFVAIVWGLSVALGLGNRGSREALPIVPAEEVAAAPDPASVVRVVPGSPLHSS